MYKKFLARLQMLKDIFKKAETILWRRGEAKTATPVISAEQAHWRIPGKIRKYAMLMSYCGRNYYGMQLQNHSNTIGLPTIERYLLDALLQLRLITAEERRFLYKIDFERGSRTDRGVSAARQICSVKLPLGGIPPKLANSGIDVFTPQTVLGPLNALLPEDIRVIGIKRVTGKFDAKRYCNQRHYTYTLPTYALSLADEVDLRTYRISDERLATANEILSLYKGRHNFFNFTKGRAITDNSCQRFIHVCDCGEPFIRGDIEFITVHIVGYSFMMHQIRKMIGLWIGVMRGLVDRDIIGRCWGNRRIHLPLAPGIGLVLNDLHFYGYYKRYGETHEELAWDEYEDALRDFRERHIDSVIYNAEITGESPMLCWLDELQNRHNFDEEELALVSNEESEEESEGTLDADVGRCEKVPAR